MFKAIRTSRQPVVLGYLLVMFVSVLSACAKPDITTVPAHPSYELDVKPLLADHCLLCHSHPATPGPGRPAFASTFTPPPVTSRGPGMRLPNFINSAQRKATRRPPHFT